MKRLTFLTACLFLGLWLAARSTATDYDLFINNGRVMDPETKYDQVANVGIKDGKIAVITKDAIKGREAIDATGLVVAPGFIDTHFRWTRPVGYKPGCGTV